MRSRVDLPEPFRPSTPILAPGKKDSEMSSRILRLGGTTLPTWFMVKTYCAIGLVTPDNLDYGTHIIDAASNPMALT